MVRKLLTPSKWAPVIAQNFVACTYHKNEKKIRYYFLMVLQA